MANYPTSIPSFPARTAGQTIGSAHMNGVQDEIVAIGTVLVNSLNVSANALTSIKFPASQTASSDVNTLDDYEEGTWTPLIGGTTGQSGQAYSVQSGTYVKVGSKVTASCTVTLSTLGTVTGNVAIKGLPFQVGPNTGDRGISPVYWAATTTSFIHLVAITDVNQTYATVYCNIAAATSMTSIVQADLSNTTSFIATFTYKVA